MKTVLRQFIREALVHEAVGSSTFGLSLSADVKLQAGDDVVDNTISSLFDSGKNSWLTRKIQERYRNAKREKKLKPPDPNKKGTVMSKIAYYGLRIAGGAAAAAGAGGVVQYITGIPIIGAAYNSLMGTGSDTSATNAAIEIADNFISFHNALDEYLASNEDVIANELMSPKEDTFNLEKFKDHYNKLVEEFITAKNLDQYFINLGQLSEFDGPIDGLINRYKEDEDQNSTQKALQGWAYLSLAYNTSEKFISGAMVLDINRYGDAIPVELQDNITDFVDLIDRKLENTPQVKDAKKAFKEVGVL